MAARDSSTQNIYRCFSHSAFYVIVVCFSILLLSLSCAICVHAGFHSSEKKPFTASIDLSGSSSAESVPIITHVALPPTIYSHNNHIIISADATDDDGIDKFTAYWRWNKQDSYLPYPVTGSGAGNKTANIHKDITPSQLQPGTTLEYYLEAYDTKLNRSLWQSSSTPQRVFIAPVSQVNASIGPAGGTITLPDGNPDNGDTTLVIPAGALLETVEISVRELDPSSVPSGNGACIVATPFGAYEFQPSNLKFLIPASVTLSFYNDSNEGPGDSLKLFWWDGFKWRFAGGNWNEDDGTLSSQIAHFSTYAIFPASLASSAFRPAERIITPVLVDNRNDVVTFDGLIGSGVTVKIFDIRGRKIKTIDGYPYEWDGTDDDGNRVESGLYVYQFKAPTSEGNKLVSGMVAVAK